jgi:hypothetical protein
MYYDFRWIHAPIQFFRQADALAAKGIKTNSIVDLDSWVMLSSLGAAEESQANMVRFTIDYLA